MPFCSHSTGVRDFSDLCQEGEQRCDPKQELCVVFSTNNPQVATKKCTPVGQLILLVLKHQMNDGTFLCSDQLSLTQSLKLLQKTSATAKFLIILQFELQTTYGEVPGRNLLLIWKLQINKGWANNILCVVDDPLGCLARRELGWNYLEPRTHGNLSSSKTVFF